MAGSKAPRSYGFANEQAIPHSTIDRLSDADRSLPRHARTGSTGLAARESAADSSFTEAGEVQRRNLRPGDKGPAVRELQTLLNTRLVPSPGLVVGSLFDAATAAAAALYKREAGIFDEWFVGPETWHALLHRGSFYWARRSSKPSPAPRPTPRPPKPPKVDPDKKLPWSLINLSYVAFIASGKEDPKPKIKWRVTDPNAAVTSGTLELFQTRDPVDPKPIWTRGLSASEVAQGDHELEWDGEIGAHADFPDSYVSIEYSPYTLKITITDGGRKESKEAKFEVVVADFEILFGDKAVLGDAKDIALHGVIDGDGGLPAAGGKRKVKLISNLYKVDSGGSDEMANGNSASFDQFKTLWGEGPRIPIDAKVWIKNSKGAKALAPKAWGRRRILWDWESVSPDLSGLHAKAKTYVESAQNYNKAVSKPKGENCHLERGGKRADDGAAAVFSADSGGTYPYPVAAGATRKWGAFSGPAPSGTKEGMSGAIFRPSRMAGDGYKVIAYFDPSPKKALDIEGAVAAAFKKDTGTFEMWREIHLAKYIKKKAAITGFAVATFQAYYDKAFVRIEDKTPSVETMEKAAYDIAFNAAIAAQPDFVKTYCIDSTVSQFDAGDFAVSYRSHAAMKAAFLAKTKADLIAADPSLTDAAATTAATTAVNTALTAQNIETVTKYANEARWWSIDICQKACGIYISAVDGITVIQFNKTDNLVPQASSVINGFAPTFTTSGRSKCAFIQYRMTYSGNSNTMEQTISHEIGHHMFLPHAPLPAASLPAGNDPDAHDKDDGICMMGYDYSAERKFCGKCLLRMRGWDHQKLDKDGTKNKKP